ncbi:MAG: histidine--tRNA ligase [Patescibacteria group bacterium]|nr:histidine--tRNA ligase [Patescibacteria group bacterium]
MNGSKAKKLSTDSYKGVRDFYPADMAVQEYIFGVWKKAVESFGYEEYGASVLEPADLYRAKSGEEIVNEQTYTFTDRGEREVTLRPEMTPTVARMVAARRRKLTFPLRWYSIPNLFRYEQPQRGRVREHWQLNVDLFGADSIEADVEVISVAYRIMKAFGAADGDFEIRINDRKAVLAGLNGARLSPEQMRAVTRLMDKKDKLPRDAYLAALKEAAGADIDPAFEESEATQAAVRALSAAGISNARFDASIVRGFDYYTGIVFEIYDADPANRRALFGGGRYDDLASLFGGDKIPAVGFGMGDVTMRDFLETHKLMPAPRAPADYYLCVMAPEQAAFAAATADRLRAAGSRVAVDLSFKKVGDQIKSADKRGIPAAVVIGPEEAAGKPLKAKDLKTGAESELP